MGCRHADRRRRLGRETLPQVIEREIETKVCAFAKAKGFWPLKLNVVAQRGFPDRMLIGRGTIFFIEFKRPGKKPRANQVAVMQRLKGYGFETYVIDNIADGQRVIAEQAALLPA